MEIGKGTYFFSPETVVIDMQRPWMISIGEYCKITRGVIILQHDYSRSVLRRVYGEIIGESKKTSIGNNVFIGMNSIILMGAQIGDNVIVGAGSVVSGKIPDNTVVGGNPARVICTLEQYFEKRKNNYVNEAVDLVTSYKKRYGVNPSVQEMGAFFPLYGERNKKWLDKNKIMTNLSGDNEKEILERYYKTMPIWDSFDDFLNYVAESQQR